MALSFIRNASLNDKYEIKTEKDVEIHTPEGYKGLLTNVIKSEILEGLIKRESTLVAPKANVSKAGVTK